MIRVRLAVLAAGLLFAVACGGEDAPAFLQPAPASLEQLTGPWQAQPYALDPLLRRRVEDTCRTDMERAAESVAAVVDARGEGVAVVRMVGPGAGACDALQIGDGGRVNGAGGGWRVDGLEQLAALPMSELADVQIGQVGGGELRVEGWSVMGRAGPQIASVVIEPAGLPQILATLENGWFAGWWPTNINDQRGAPAPQPDVVVRGYDAAGTLLHEVHLVNGMVQG
jgi:hypothetical protein